MQLSRHFSLEELTRSDYATRKGIDNTPDSDVLACLRVLADGLERVRTVLAVPIHVTSGYRNILVNKGVGGSGKSKHCYGLAADFVAPEAGSPREVVEKLAEHAEFVRFDQLIYEGTWVHVSFGEHPRGEVLTAQFLPGGVIYQKGVV